MSLNTDGTSADFGHQPAAPDPAACIPMVKPVRAAPSPRVSVVVLNHNGERIIGKCLDHLMAQTFDDFEIVVVDNDSADASLAVMEKYLGSGRLSIVRSGRNLGVPGGRNLGVKHVQGSIIAFIDNDGYADPNWLRAVVDLLDSDARLGVVAPVVFFAGKKIIMNGAGGTVNLQGYGGDYCFDTPYEFAQLPHHVLYAMGCGMVARRSVLESVGPLDERLFNYYDDTELGIRAWKSGYQVAVAPDAWIDHGFGYSDKILGNKAFLCERNRIRTVIKYFPVLRLPAWLGHEFAFTAAQPRETVSILIRAWQWNLVHLPSAIRLRIKFALRRGSFFHLLAPSWGHYPPPAPNNQTVHPDPSQAKNCVLMDGKTDIHQLNFGWYDAESEGTRTFRWSAPQASAWFRLRNASLSCTVAFSAPKDRETRIVIRPLGSLKASLDKTFRVCGEGWTWQTYPAHLPAGDYEVLLLCEDILIDRWNRKVGIAVLSINFD